jgi:hypothetical protein
MNIRVPWQQEAFHIYISEALAVDIVTVINWWIK